ncbi:MAG: CidA/LrgA family protein, partial [Vibrio sp.]
MFSKAMGYGISFALILACLAIGNGIQQLLGVSVPGSIFGMLLLFLLLASGIIKREWVQPSAQLFIRYMTILFVPISVGLMTHFDMLQANAFTILLSAVGGTFIVLVLLSLGL